MAEVMSLTAADIRADVEDKFGDSGNVQITGEMILRWINAGIRHIVDQNAFLKLTAQTNLVAGQQVYDLGAAFPTARLRTVHSVMVNGYSIDLVPFAEFQGYVNNLNVLDTPGAARYGSMHGGVLTLWPIPSESVVNGLTIYYDAYPEPVLDTDWNDPLPIPDRLFNALNDYVFSQALELDKNPEFAQVKRQHAEDGIRRQAERESASPTDWYPAISLDPDDDDNRYW